MNKWFKMLLCLLLCATMVFTLAACGNSQNSDKKDSEKTRDDETEEVEDTGNTENTENPENPGGSAYQVTVIGVNEVPQADISIRVYADESMENLEGVFTTDETGLAVMDLPEGKYYICLDGVSTAYTYEDYYILEGRETEIFLPMMISTYLVSVVDDAGQPVVDAQVDIYTDDTLSEPLFSGWTDGNGTAIYEQDYSQDYVVVVTPPEGYLPLEDNTPVPFDQNMHAMVTLQRNPGEPNFTVTTVDGKQISLYEELQTKDAVLVLFWFGTSDPCRLTLNQLQEVYAPYADRVTILALNPVEVEFPDGWIDKEKFDFEFAMVPMSFAADRNITAFPSYLLIDQSGLCAYSGIGSLEDSSTWASILDYITQEDYQSKVVTLEDILG